MPIDMSLTFLQPLVRAFAQSHHTVYLVGGFVRNRLLSLPASDIDLCGDASPDEVVSFAQSAGYKATIRDCELGTVDLCFGDEQAEYTPFRTEQYAPGGAHRPQAVSFTSDLRADACRRDFTVNALYQNLQTGELEDPLCGLDDLHAFLLRACNKNAYATLESDGLRILRMARLCGELGFTPDDELLNAAAANSKNLLDLSPSRIFGEWRRICLCDQKYPSLSSTLNKPLFAIDLLHRCDALRVLVPALYDGAGVEQNKNYHRYDVFWHGIHTFAASPPDVVLRTAALLHDIGKPYCVQQPSGHMYGHPEKSAEVSRPILHTLGIPTDLQRDILLLIQRHMFDLNGQAKESTVRIRFATWGFDFAQRLILLRQSDVLGSGMQTQEMTAEKWTRILYDMKQEGAIDDIRLLAVGGHDIQRACSLLPGARIGRIKQLLFERCALSPHMNRADVLLREAVNINRQLGED